MKHYEARLDKIFAKGSLWKHRTFRTVLDSLSSEYEKTTMDQKVKYLKTLVDHGENLETLLVDYKIRYLEQNRKDIADEADKTLAKILFYLLKKENEKELNTKAII